MKNRFWIFAGLFLVVVVTGISITYFCLRQPRYSMESALDLYGFSKPSQKEDIKDLLSRSSVIPPMKRWQDVFPKRSNKERLSGDLITLLKGTQNRFVLRSGLKERWETEPLEWMTKDVDKSFNQLKNLGFIDEIGPQTRTVDAIGVLGSTYSSMERRLAYAEKLVQQGILPKSIIFLTGERFVTEAVDGTDELLQKIAASFGIKDWRMLTETHLMTFLYRNSPLSKRGIPLFVIDTPSRNGQRPTTQTTVFDFHEWAVNHPEIQTVVFVSNQPYVLYQSAVIEATLASLKSTLRFEVVGPMASPERQIKSVLGAFGSYIWAKTPLVLQGLDIKLDAPPIAGILEKLYTGHPLMYQLSPTALPVP